MARKTIPDLSGQRFGRYLVLRKDESRCDSRGRYDYYICRCDCGTIRSVKKYELLCGKSKSCGCFAKERIKAADFKHGYSRTRLYHIYHMMRYRCYNPKYSGFKNYGGRGVIVCDEWLADPMNFIKWALDNGYDDKLSIDRIDVNGNYEPNNCRWANQKVQQRNKANAFLIVFDGVERSFADVCDENGVSRRNAWQHWMRHKDKTKLVEYIKSHAFQTS